MSKEEIKDLKPFNLEKAKKGAPVCTRDGRSVRIICFDCKDVTFPIIALVSGSSEREEVISYDEAGHSTTRNQEDTLFMIPEKKVGWVNVYKGNCYRSEEEAKENAESCFDEYIKTIKVEWEE